jgi:hypothetical protein
MGTVSCSNWKTKKDVVNELTHDLARSGFNVLGQKGAAEGVWYLIEKNGEKTIYFGKIEKNRGEFFLKTMSEDMGPYYFTCPLKFIEKASEPKSEYAQAWREKVRTYHAAANKKLSVGVKIKLYDNLYTVVSQHVLGRGSNWIVTNEQGQRFRLKRTQIRDIEILGE